MVDALVVRQDDPGDVEVVQLSNPTRDRAGKLGSVIVGPIRLGEDSAEGTASGAVAGGERADEGELRTIGGPEDCDIVEDVLNGSAAQIHAADAGQNRPVHGDHRTPNGPPLQYINRNRNDPSAPGVPFPRPCPVIKNWLAGVRPRRAYLKADVLAGLPGAISSVPDGMACAVLPAW